MIIGSAILILVLIFFYYTSVRVGYYFLKIISYLNKSDEVIDDSFLFFIGQSLLVLLWFIINLLFTYPQNTFLAVFLLALINIRSGKEIKIATLSPLFKDLRTSVFSFFLIILLIFYFALSFQKSTEWDDIAYHQPVVEEISQGKLKFPLLQESPYLDFYSPFSVFYGSLPFNSETAASLIYSLSGNNVAAAPTLYLINFLIFFKLCYVYLSNRYGKSVNVFLFIVLMILTNYGISILISTGLIDINVAIYQFLSILCIVVAIEKKSKNFYCLSIAFFASACGHKFITIYLLPVFSLYSLWFLTKIKIKMSDYILYILFFILFGGFWYVKNTILHYNPIYPLYLGHIGVSDVEYEFLTDSLIHGIRTSSSVTDLIKIIKTSYVPETSTIIAFIGSSFYLLHVLRRKAFEWMMFVAAFSLFLFNLLIGSQLSRYVLVLPILLHLSLYPVLKRFPILIILALVIGISSYYNSPLQRSVFDARISKIKTSLDSTNKISSNSCLDNTINFFTQFNVESNSVLNLWDAYASVYYQKQGYFFNFKGESTYDTGLMERGIKYIFINENEKKIILSNTFLHRDMKPDYRLKVESDLLLMSDEIFNEDYCVVYKLRSV